MFDLNLSSMYRLISYRIVSRNLTKCFESASLAALSASQLSMRYRSRENCDDLNKTDRDRHAEFSPFLSNKLSNNNNARSGLSSKTSAPDFN